MSKFTLYKILLSPTIDRCQTYRFFMLAGHLTMNRTNNFLKISWVFIAIILRTIANDCMINYQTESIIKQIIEINLVT
jgi:hypothetical protein